MLAAFRLAQLEPRQFRKSFSQRVAFARTDFAFGAAPEEVGPFGRGLDDADTNRQIFQPGPRNAGSGALLGSETFLRQPFVEGFAHLLQTFGSEPLVRVLHLLNADFPKDFPADHGAP